MKDRKFLTRKFTNKLILAAIGVLNLFIYSNCFVRRPELTNRNVASATFFHTGAETSCNSCHSARRPTTPVGPSYTFDHTSSAYGGQGDCINCHTSQITWSGGLFSHDPQPDTCQNCHTAQRPTTLVGNPLFDHNLNGRSDCYGCHAASTTAYNTMSDWAGAVATPSNLIGNKTISVTVGTPAWSNTAITSVTSSAKNFPLQMLHTSLQIPAAFTGTCTNCHAGAAAANPDYRNGVFHASVTAAGKTQPVACIDCHRNTAPSGFVGPAGSGRSPASSEMRHDAVVWSADSSGTWAPTTTKIVTQECTICHTGITPGAAGGWISLGATYHAKLTANAVAQPTSCLDCHANNRPSGATGPTNFVHTNAGGLGDCATCHATGAASNSFTTWTNTGVFSHAGQTSCSGCHAGNRPANTTGWVQTTWSASSTTFNLSTHANTTDCYTCHSSTLTGGTFTSMANWQGGNFTHSPAPSTCVNCHSYPTSTTPNLAGSGLTYMNHTGFGGQDCAGCHVSPPNFTSISGWGGAAATPSGLVNGTGSAWNIWSVSVGTISYTAGSALSTATVTTATANFPQQMLHSSPQVPAGIKNSCATCHTSGMIATSGTQFHTHVASTQISNCNSCHTTTAATPNGIVGPLGVVSTTNKPNMHHKAAYSSGATIVAAQDCSACHKSTVGTSWKDGVFHANKGANTINTCFSCHIQRMPTTLIQMPAVIDKFSHTASVVKSDCASCHPAASAGPTGSWTTTTRIHTVIAAASFTSCKSCHTTTPSPDTWGRHSKHRGYDCYTCHNNSASANSIGNNWITGTSTNGSPCNQCH